MPFIYPHLALMPDAHLGKGATVGSVIPTLGAIIPAAVGVDIGCGMIAVRTQFAGRRRCPSDRRAAARRRSSRRSRCRPARANRDGQPRRTAEPRLETLRGAGGRGRLRPGVVRRQLAAAAGLARVGQPLHRGHASTRPDRVWLFLHSGSPRRRQQDRAAPHRGRAASCASSGGSRCPTATWPTWSRAPTSSGRYIRELRWAQHFALLNREEMMDRVVAPASSDVGRRPVVERGARSTATTTSPSRRRTSASEVWVSRKGAIEADVGRRRA